MSSLSRVSLYCLVIVLGAVAGGIVPLYTREQKRLISFLAFAAGVLLGAAFFHMLPEAFRAGGYASFSYVPAGFLLLFLLERYLLVHVCEEPPDCQEHAHHAIGLTAFIGLSVHTLFDGVALASAASEGIAMMAFLAIAAHKVPSSLSLAAILKSEGRSHRSILLLIGIFGLMVPLGAALFFGLNALLKLQTFAPKALAFSGGTFLYIAVSDLLPHVNRHGKDRRWVHLLALMVGLLMMLGLSALPESGHEPPIPAGTADRLGNRGAFVLL